MFEVAHLGFIVASYVLFVLVVGGMVAAIVLEHRRLTRELARFESRRGDDRS